MFSGLQELLVIVLVVLGLFLIPRMMNPRPPEKDLSRHPSARPLSWKLRLGIVLSLLWPLACAAYFKPWKQAALPFVVIGIGPVLVAWSARWVAAGLRKGR